MKRILFITTLSLATALFLISCRENSAQNSSRTSRAAKTAAKTAQSQTTDLSILAFGAVPDGVTDCTQAFNAAIKACSELTAQHAQPTSSQPATNPAKARIVVPKGQYLTYTIELLSNVELYLEEGAEIIGGPDPEKYRSFVPKRDMSQYDSGDGTVNQNNSKDERWNKALILANDTENITLSGPGKINGMHLFDPLGEEHMRGPHTVIFGDCRNVILQGIHITCAANYAFMGYALQNAVFQQVTITEGWDGIHIRGGENVVINGCHFETGDDAIAGGYWTNMVISGCYLNSSCNGLRMIMPSKDVLITGCTFEGPGRYPHRTSGAARRTNMLFGMVFEPGGWGAAPGVMEGITVTGCTTKNVSSPIGVSVSSECEARDLTVSHLTATGTYGTLSPIVCYNDSGFRSITLTDYTVER